MPPDRQGIFSLNQSMLSNEVSRLLVNNAHWTREYILISAFDVADIEPSANQLAQSAMEIATFYGQFYGDERATVLKSLLTVYNFYATQVIDALRENDMQKANLRHQEWSNSAEAIAQFMSEQNRNINKDALQASFETLIYLTENEAMLILSGNYTESISKYDEIVSHVAKMAWDISYAISGVYNLNA